MKVALAIIGIIACFVILAVPTPHNLLFTAQALIAIAFLMCFFWITEVIPIAVTSLLPILLYPILKITPISTVSSVYSNHFIFLFLGGMWIATAMQVHNLHKRIALSIVKLIGVNLNGVILGFIIATSFISLWISNTATTVIMLPIAMAVLSHVEDIRLSDHPEKDRNLKSNFAKCLMLAIAYSATIGGMGSIIGTATNMIFVGQIKTLFPNVAEVSFLKWMVMTIPFVVVLLFLTYLLLTKFAFRLESSGQNDAHKIISEQLRLLGPMNSAQKRISLVFFVAVILWVFRMDIDLGLIKIRGWEGLLDLRKYSSDAVPAMFVATFLFVVPAGDGQQRKLLEWKEAVGIPWGALLLLGGGFALAEGFVYTGLDKWIGGFLTDLESIPEVIIIFFVGAVITLLSEFASNTATIAMSLPILAVLCGSLSLHPYFILMPATIAASCGFALPVATPPNAIVFGSERLKVKDMVKAGILLDIIAVLLLTLFFYFWIRLFV